MKKKKLSIIFSIFGLAILMVGLLIGVKQVGERQEVRTRAVALPQYQQIRETSGQAGAGEAGGANEAEIGKWVVPSINGFASDAFTGAATVSYPIQLPAGIRGLQPNLSLHYSSSTVDDARLKEKSLDWQRGYKVQADYAGLGWSLGGLGYITKDRTVYPHQYYLVFPGGSARLLAKEGANCEWETSPKLFAKISHCVNKHYDYQDTNHWEIITKDGAHYIFGEQVLEDGRPQTWTSLENNSPTSLLVINNNANTKSRMEPNKWQLSRIFDVHGNEVRFYYQQELRQYQGGHYPHQYYARAILPTKIEYGLYRVEFAYQDKRTDYKVPGWDDGYQQSFWTKKLLKEIKIFSDSQLLRKYVLTHEYTPAVAGVSGDLSNKHAVLTKIEHQGRGGQGGLPPYIFTYDSLNHLRGADYVMGDIYLITANNGYGGQVSYEYQWFDSIRYYNRNSEFRDGDQTTSRARLTKKTVEDGRGNSFGESYGYDNAPVAYVQEGAGYFDKNGDFKGFEYLGHSQVEVKLSEKNNHQQIASQSRSSFHQYLAAKNCFRVDSRKGMAFRQEVLDAGASVLTKTESQFGVEINGQVFENPVCADIPGTTMEDELAAQFFVFNRRTDNFLTDFPGVQKRTASANLEYDFVFGNLKSSVQYGEVDFQSGADLDAADNKYSFTEYATPNLQNWLVSLPAQTYLSNTADGAAKYQKTHYAYDGQDFGQMPPKGLLTRTKIQDESTGFEAISRIEYNHYGLPVKTWDARGGLTEIVYDARFLQLPIKSLAYLNGGQQLVSQTEYDHVLGLPVKMIDPNEQISRVEYDHYGRVLAMYGPLDSANQPAKTYQYFDPLPHVQIGSKVFEAGELDAGSHYNYTRQIFNGLGQTIQSQVLKTIIEDQEQDVLTTVEFNSRGQAVRQTQAQPINPQNSASPQFFSIDFNQAIRTETSYDDLGRPVVVRSLVPGNPDLNSENRLAYAGWTTQTRVEKERGQSVFASETKDAFGRTAMTATCLDSTYPQDCSPEQQLISRLKYDLLDNVIESWSEKAGQTTQKIINRYDRLGWKTDFDDPDLGAWRFEYDQNNNLIKQIDAKEQEIRFEYDALNRLTKKIYPNDEEIRFEYDAFDPALGQYGRGRQTKMIDLTGFTETKYNQAGLPTESKKQVFDQFVTSETEYYVSGLIKSLVQADGERISYQYNQAGQMIGAAGDQQGNYLSDIHFNRFGAVSGQVLGNQTQTTTNYDDLGRLTQLANFQYQFDLLGNIKT